MRSGPDVARRREQASPAARTMKGAPVRAPVRHLKYPAEYPRPVMACTDCYSTAETIYAYP